jgi:hypothetical protein
MTDPSDSEAERKRIQRSRNRVVALLLAGMAILVYFISMARMG